MQLRWPHRIAVLALVAGCADTPPPAAPEPAARVEAPRSPDWCPVQGEAWSSSPGWQEWLAADLNQDGHPDRVVADGPPGAVPREVRVLVDCHGTERIALAIQGDGVEREQLRHAGYAALKVLYRDSEGAPRAARYLFSPAQGRYVTARDAAGALGCPAPGMRVVELESTSDFTLAVDGVKHSIRWTGNLDDGPRSDWILGHADTDGTVTYRVVVACDGGLGAVVHESEDLPEVGEVAYGWRVLRFGTERAVLDPVKGVYR